MQFSAAMDLRERFPLTVDPDDAGLRLDQFFARKLPEISRARWVRLIEKGFVVIDDKNNSNPAQRLKVNSRVTLAPDAPLLDEKGSEESKNFTPEFLGQAPEIIYEDTDLLVVHKPVGLAVHPGAGMPWNQTLVAWAYASGKLGKADSKDFLAWGDEILEEGRPGIVHRLDMPTSGLMVIAKNPSVHAALSEQFRTREASRLYFALVPAQALKLMNSKDSLPQRLEAFLKLEPCPIALRKSPEGFMSFACFLERDPVNRTKFRVSKTDKGAKKALMHLVFSPAQMGPKPEFAWAEVKLETGRTHQIRVQLSFLNLAILGDGVYFGEKFERLMLHAHTLLFTHPKTKDEMKFSAPFPFDFTKHNLIAPKSRILEMLPEKISEAEPIDPDFDDS